MKTRTSVSAPQSPTAGTAAQGSRPRTPTAFAVTFATAATVLASLSPSFSQAPATDIVTLDIQTLHDRNPIVQRVTDREAYDNQPQFLPDGRLVFTAASETTTKIHVFDFEQAQEKVLFSLAEDLYSATPVPGENAVSVIRDYGNQVQQLWKLPLDGTAPTPLQTAINPIGYHAWIDQRRLILFVLGEPQTLELMTLGSERAQFLHDAPGRALAQIPGSRWGTTAMSFSRPAPGADKFELVAYQPGEAASQFSTIVELPSASQDYAWAPDGSVWTGRGTELLRFEGEEWEVVVDFEALGLGSISRLAWSGNGERLAVVIDR